MRHCWAGLGRAGFGRLGRVGQGWRGLGRAGQGWAGLDRAGRGSAGQGWIGLDRAGQGWGWMGWDGMGGAKVTFLGDRVGLNSLWAWGCGFISGSAYLGVECIFDFFQGDHDGVAVIVDRLHRR
jgi:hypothetical protein